MKHSPEFYQRKRLYGIMRRFIAVMDRLHPSKIDGRWGCAAAEGSDAWNRADRDRGEFDAALGRGKNCHSIRIRQFDRDRMVFDEALGRRKNHHSIRIRQHDDLVTQIYVDDKPLNLVRSYRIHQEGWRQPIVLDVTVDVDWGTVTHRYLIHDLTIITPESLQ